MRTVITLAGLVIVLTGVRAANEIVVPLLFSAFLATVLAWPLGWLQRRGIPSSIATSLTLIGILVLGIGATILVGRPILSVLRNQASYRQQLEERISEFSSWVESQGIPIPESDQREQTVSDQVWQLVDSMLSAINDGFSNGLLILILVAFILFEASGFPSKIRSLPGNAEDVLARCRRIVDDVRRYMAIKTAISALTGLAAYGLLIACGVGSALLWGVVAFLLNYIPNVGSVLAAVPPVLIALVESGPAMALVVILGYLVINAIVGYILEPNWMGRGLGLSTLVVILSLIFWGWLLGATGLLLSVPLTMVVKIALESSEETRWIGILLGEGTSHSESLEDPSNIAQSS